MSDQERGAVNSRVPSWWPAGKRIEANTVGDLRRLLRTVPDDVVLTVGNELSHECDVVCVRAKYAGAQMMWGSGMPIGLPLADEPQWILVMVPRWWTPS